MLIGNFLENKIDLFKDNSVAKLAPNLQYSLKGTRALSFFSPKITVSSFHHQVQYSLNNQLFVDNNQLLELPMHYDIC